MQEKTDLEAEYPKSKQLFRCIFLTGDTGINALVAEAKLVKPSSKLEEISQLFTRMNTAIRGLGTQKARAAIKPLLDECIFPIRKSEEQSGFDDLHTLGNSTSWFIADRDHLRDKFCGKVPLLAFMAADVQQMDDLLKAMKIDSRKISGLVKSGVIVKGTVSLHREYSK